MKNHFLDKYNKLIIDTSDVHDESIDEDKGMPIIKPLNSSSIINIDNQKNPDSCRNSPDLFKNVFNFSQLAGDIAKSPEKSLFSPDIFKCELFQFNNIHEVEQNKPKSEKNKDSKISLSQEIFKVGHPQSISINEEEQNQPKSEKKKDLKITEIINKKGINHTKKNKSKTKDKKDKNIKIFNVYHGLINPKKKGRKEKGKVSEKDSGKYRPDNIQRKIKNHKLESIRILINNSILDNYKELGMNEPLILRKIDKTFASGIKIFENIKERDLKIKEIFCRQQSTKYKVSDKVNFNQEIINKIEQYPKSREYIYLNTTWSQWNDIYIDINNSIKYGFQLSWLENFKSLDKDLKIIGQNNSNNYVEKYKKAAINYENYFSKNDKKKKNN